MNDLLRELQETFYHEIPITQHLGIRADSYDGEHLILKAPLENNINHKQTAFAGSLNALATLAGWGEIWLILRALGIPNQVVIQDSTSEFLRPVKSDFFASCRKPNSTQVARIESSLKKKGKARVELTSEIYTELHDDNAVAMRFKGRYVIFLQQ